VDGTYPLACYRAAMRALPEDVRQYSDADREIARALAYARQGLRDPGPGPAAPATKPKPAPPPPPRERAERTTSSAARASHSAPAPSPTRRAEQPEASPGARPVPALDGPVRLASAAGPVDGTGLPYPVIVLATLAALLVATAGGARLAARRRRRGDLADR